jgi:magnesium transporter
MPYDELTHARRSWIDITRPSPEDIARLGKAHPNFHPLDLEDCLSRIERPKIDDYDDYMFVVMHFPVWDSERRISRPSEVDFFIGTGYFVTVHDGELKSLANFFEQCKDSEETRSQYFGSAGLLLYTVIDRLVDYIFPILYKVDANIRHVEETMFDDDMRRTIADLSVAQRDIIALRRIVRPQVAIVHNLEQVERPFIREGLDVYFGDILDHLQKARDIVEDNAEMIASLADATDALASHRINEVMRILTVISVIMLPLTLIAGIFGMNVPLPFPRHSATFWWTLAGMLVISLAMLAYFRHRNWL